MRYWPILSIVVIHVQTAAAAAFMSGKVTMEDGSPPPAKVLIQRVCPGNRPLTEGVTDKRGFYMWRVLNDQRVVCWLQASLSGYESTKIDTSQDRLYFSPVLPTLVLRRQTSEPENEPAAALRLPPAAAKSWALGMRAVNAKKWGEAELLLRETVHAAPKFAPAWVLIGISCENQQKVDDARDAYTHAIDADPSILAGYLNRMRLEVASRNWPEASKAAAALINADTGHRYLEAYLASVVAGYAMHDLDAVERTLNVALPLDKKHELPRLEYFMGAVLGAKGDLNGAAEHLKKYLELAPKADDAAAVRSHLENLATVNALPLPAQAVLTAVPENPNLPVIGDTWVPGGMKALAFMARLQITPSYENFFLEYCRGISLEVSKLPNMRIPGYLEDLQTYMAAVAELVRLGEHRGDATVIKLSLAAPAQLQRTKEALSLFGWKVVEEDGAARLEPGDQAADGPRQRIPAAFGVDEVAMQQALQAGKTFQFEIPSETARLIGGVAWWGTLMQGFSAYSGGITEAFARDSKLAKTYAALAGMPADAAQAVVAPVGIRKLAADYSDVLWLYTDKFSVSSGAVGVPGGVSAEKVWAKLVGANPHDPPAFLHALITADRGGVAAFYSAIAHADTAHQRFFTKDVARAQRFYNWYRYSDQSRTGIPHPALWRSVFFQKAPLDELGNLRFPGGRADWTTSSAPDDEALLHLASLEILVAIAELEEKRGAHFDDTSAKLLAQHFNEWHALFPYFEELPGLGGAEFAALEALSRGVAGYGRSEQNLVMGVWHSLVALIVIGRKAGSLDDATGVRAFRHACEGLLARDYSARAVAVLREIAGAGPNLDEGVADRLLRLGGLQRAAFERVRELQGATRLQALGESPDPGTTLNALAAVVYGAVVHPDSLLVNEDPTLIARHQYVPDPCLTCSSASVERLNLFSPASLVAKSDPPGSHLTGGFMHFDAVARNLVKGGSAVDAPSRVRRAANPAAAPAGSEAALPSEVIFRTNAALVQVFATITDTRGHYIDDFARDQFIILQDAKPARLAAFENATAEISCALLLDTTQSMQTSLPALKNGALKLVGRLRPNDSVAVYAIGGGITELQPFTTDKDAAARAVLKTEAGGMTALYDGLVRVTRDIGGRAGKKMIVVFTDGDDNISTLSSEAAILRAKSAGVPIYTIAKGSGLRDETAQQLKAISKATGGLSFTLYSASETASVFEKVLQDAMHGYLLAFHPLDSEGHEWHSIEVVLKAPKGRKVRAREGYFAEPDLRRP